MLDQSHNLFIDDFLAELVQGNAAIFAGAGLSASAGFVDWRELLRPLARELELNIDLETDLVALAQFHVTHSGRNRHKLHIALLEALAKDAKPTRNHDLLAALPITTYWTTNYDKLIEDTLHNRGEVVDVKSSVPQLAITRPNRTVTLYKMHGDIERPDAAIITKDDYESYGREYGAFVTALSGDLVKKTFLFLGFSFSDPNLDHVLSQIRLNFAQNQRQHFAIFRRRQQLDGEKESDFQHHLARQRHTIEDLKRFNIKTILIDNYSQITEILNALVDRFRRRTIFISASAFDFAPWGRDHVQAFAEELGRRIIADGSRIATGLGLGIGDAIFTGALRELMNQRVGIEESLTLRPFPHAGDPSELADLWKQYRHEIISHAGISVFLFGNKETAKGIAVADGMYEEFEISRKQRTVLVPIGATNYAAAELAERVLAEPKTFLPEMNDRAVELVARLSKPTNDLRVLIDPILEVIRILQGKS